nr:hypothetical protein [uncultured Psychroserpens sp.]
MKVYCKRCNQNEAFEVPEFSISEKRKIRNLKIESSLKAIKTIVDNYSITHRDAKFVVRHINLEYGSCNRCDVNDISTEYSTCPKCNAMNFNWKMD